jgi:hypothetical protein
MSYQLTESGNIIGGESFESFWLFIRFTVAPANGTLMIQNAGNYFAFYNAVASDNRKADLPEFDTKNYTLKGVTESKLSLGLNSLALQESRCTDLSNESSHLHLFEFQMTDNQKPSGWVNDGSWSGKFEPRTRNHRPNQPFIEHKVKFGDCDNQDVFWTMSRDTANGTDRFAVAQTFLKGSLLASALGAHGQDCPTLTVSVKGKDWKAFDTQPLPGAATGYVMICAGAFRQMALSAELETWHNRTSGAPAPDEILDALSVVVERRGVSEEERQAQFERTLHTVHVTKDNSVVQEDPRLPVEVMYVNMNIGAGKEVPRMIKYG